MDEKRWHCGQAVEWLRQGAERAARDAARQHQDAVLRREGEAAKREVVELRELMRQGAEAAEQEAVQLRREVTRAEATEREAARQSLEAVQTARESELVMLEMVQAAEAAARAAVQQREEAVQLRREAEEARKKPAPATQLEKSSCGERATPLPSSLSPRNSWSSSTAIRRARLGGSRPECVSSQRRWRRRRWPRR